tara:strand:+ start:154 stop:483 length:330 start_codon:yes stop_codon:yes gene_type:complete
MSKTKLRQEYEAVFGVVEGLFRLYDAKGNMIYREESDGGWCKREFDARGKMIYWKNYVGTWLKREYEASGKMIYREHSIDGVTLDKRPCAGKVFIEEQTGKKFKLTEIK